ncbi:MAG: hypothetical protein CL878_07465 [Dehalococcoidia bacterium]|nr:hypothetical protein [Dehalococcoidia bacterium]
MGALIALVAVSCGSDGEEANQAAPAAPQTGAAAGAPTAPPPTTVPPSPTSAPRPTVTLTQPSSTARPTAPLQPTALPQAPTPASPIAAPPTVAPPAATEAPAEASGVAHFQVVGESSQASYTTREKFFRLPAPNFATGVTSAITGDIYLDRTTWQLAADPPSVITVDISTLQSDQSRRDNFIRRRFLESNQFPTATFVLKQVAGVPQPYSEGTEVTVVLEGELTVREINRPVSWQGTVNVQGNTLTGKVGTSELLYADFGIPKIRIATLEVEDWFKLDMELTAKSQ